MTFEHRRGDPRQKRKQRADQNQVTQHISQGPTNPSALLAANKTKKATTASMITCATAPMKKNGNIPDLQQMAADWPRQASYSREGNETVS